MRVGESMKDVDMPFARAVRSAALGTLLPALTAMLLLLGGCSGNNGKDGADGTDGSTVAVSPGNSALTMTITGASIDETSTVNFKLIDANGLPYVGLAADTVEVTIAKLIVGTEGDANHWQSYINEAQTPNGLGAGTQDTAVATTDTGGSLVDHKDGNYTYTFGTRLTHVADPLPVDYDPALTHRIAIAVRDETGTMPSVSNGIYTWQPSTGATTGITTSDIVEMASCNTCHTGLNAHGGPRKDTRLCVTCHNPGSIDASSGNSLDFNVMIHRIHAGSELPSVVAGTPYVIYGYRNSKNDYSKVAFPQDLRNCTTCHNPDDSNTPQASLFKTAPTIEACSSCHDDIDFSKGVEGGHAGGVVTDNTQCTVCHAENRVAGSVLESHRIPGKVAAANFRYNILSIDNTAPGQFPIVKFSVTNPNNNDAAYNILADKPFTAGSASTLYVDIAWNTGDYNNAGSGSNPGQPVHISALSKAASNGDGTFTVTSGVAVPSTVTGTGTVAIEGHPAGDFDGDGSYSDRVPVTSVAKDFVITDGAATARRTTVSLTKCQTCHGSNDGLSFHGNNRTDNVQVCAMCHNPNATDISMRPASDTTDGLTERTIDFKYMIHAIHGAAQRSNAYVIYGYGNAVSDFSDVLYPGTVANCVQCHDSTSYEVPLASAVLGTTIDTSAGLADPSAYGRISPTSAVCASCHDDDTSLTHMKQNGGTFWATESQIGTGSTTTESCSICHGAGALADVSTMHDIQ